MPKIQELTLTITVVDDRDGATLCLAARVNDRLVETRTTFVPNDDLTSRFTQVLNVLSNSVTERIRSLG